MRENKVSIIVPIYNMELYLDDCLQSCENQTIVDDIEVIMVDDGSTDNSNEIMNKYMDKNPELFKGYTIENGGLGNARNFGLTKANGEYIAFIDSDDIISDIFCELQYEAGKKNNADVVRSDYRRFRNPDDVFRYIETTDQVSTKYMNYIKKNGAVQEKLDTELQLLIWHTACMGIYKKELIDKLDFKFPVGKFEDPVMKIMFLFANKIVIVPYRLYHYRQREGSITDSLTLEDRDIAFERWQGILDEYEKHDALYNTGIIDAFFVTAASYSLITTDLYNNTYQEIEKKYNDGEYDKYISFYKHIDPEVRMVSKNKKNISRFLNRRAILAFYKGDLKKARKLVERDYKLVNFRKKRIAFRERFVKNTTKNIRKIFSNDKLSKLRNKYFYAYYYQRKQVNNNTVLLEAYHGKNFNGNVYYLGRELDKLDKYNIYIASNSQIDFSGFKNVKVIKYKSKKYYKLLASAKYIFNNTSFPSQFIKKDNQVVVNTWHGTPLKTLGNDMKIDRYKFGNIQRTVGLSNMLVLSNEFTIEKMLKTHGLEQLLKNRTYELPSPRNSVFFDKLSEREIREEYNLLEKKVVVYMPTWRGSVWESKDTNESFIETAKKLSQKLGDEYIIYVKFHSNNDDFHFAAENDNIRYFPEECETYRFLNVADILITDYSSVMFDYAIKNREIILYCPDIEEYEQDRGMYFDPRKLGFNFTKEINEVIKIIFESKEKKDYEINRKFNKHDSLEGAKETLNYILDKTSEVMYKEEQDLVFYGRINPTYLNLNTRSLLERKYTAVFHHNIGVSTERMLDELTDNCEYYPYIGLAPLTVFQKFLNNIFIKNRGIAKYIALNNFLVKCAKIDTELIFGHIKINRFLLSSPYTKKNIYTVITINAKEKAVLLNGSYIRNINVSNAKLINRLFNNVDKIVIDETDGNDYSLIIKNHNKKVISYDEYLKEK